MDQLHRSHHHEHQDASHRLIAEHHHSAHHSRHGHHSSGKGGEGGDAGQKSGGDKGPQNPLKALVKAMGQIASGQPPDKSVQEALDAGLKQNIFGNKA